jgi:hypothetical protein
VDNRPPRDNTGHLGRDLSPAGAMIAIPSAGVCSPLHLSISRQISSHSCCVNEDTCQLGMLLPHALTNLLRD